MLWPTPKTTLRDSGRVRRRFARPWIIFRGRAFFCCTSATICNGQHVNRHQPTMTIHELRQEIRDRRALARHAKHYGLRVARRWHVELALDSRRQLRAFAAR